MSYKAILSTRHPTKEALLSYYERKCRDIEYQVMKFYESLVYKALAKETERLEKKKERTLSKRLKNEEIKYKSAIKSLKTGEIVIKKRPDTVSKIKHKAYAHFQRYCRLLRADRSGMVRLLDTGKMVHFSKAQGGHYWSKHNHPNLAFDPSNCRPISAIGNKMQGDQPGHYWKDSLIERIGIDNFSILESISKETDTTIRTRSYWEDMEQVRNERLKDLENERIVNGRAV